MFLELDLPELAESLGLEIENIDAFNAYVELFGWFPIVKYTAEEIKAHVIAELPKWVENSIEYLIMELDADIWVGEREANFTERYINEYVDVSPSLDWIKIDYQATWNSALRFDFEIADRFVFSNH